MLDHKLLDLLACPACHRPLRLLAADTLERLNARIQGGGVRYSDGELVREALDAGLVTDNGALIYRIDDDIPILLVERGIPARQIEQT